VRGGSKRYVRQPSEAGNRQPINLGGEKPKVKKGQTTQENGEERDQQPTGRAVKKAPANDNEAREKRKKAL